MSHNRLFMSSSRLCFIIVCNCGLIVFSGDSLPSNRVILRNEQLNVLTATETEVEVG